MSALLAEFVRANGLEKQFYEHKIVEAWPQVLGPTAARYTTDIIISEGMLYVHVKSAPLRQELFNCRFQLVEKLHEAVGAKDIIKDIRILS